MSYYEDVYLKRLNRYGKDYQSRIQNQREKVFEDKLLKSVYRVDFLYEGKLQPATLERFKQDETKTLQYLLTRTDLKIPAGTIIMIPDSEKVEKPWMIYWLETIQTSGYNKYIVLSMTWQLSWQDRQGKEQKTWAYLYGQEDNMLKDEIRSRSRKDTIYSENLKHSFFILPRNVALRKDDYIEIGEDELKEGFTVTGYDILSTPGVEYVTVDPVYLRDHSDKATILPNDNPDETFWLQIGGKKE